MRAYSWLDGFHVLPRAGGMLDQTPAFLSFVRTVGVERYELDAEERRIAQKK